MLSNFAYLLLSSDFLKKGFHEYHQLMSNSLDPDQDQSVAGHEFNWD